MKIAVNNYISGRGASGSSRGAGLVMKAIEGRHEIIELSPAKRARSRLSKLGEMLSWDFYRCPRLAGSASADVLIHCTNTGVGAKGLKTIVIAHDMMPLDHPNLFDAHFQRYFTTVVPASLRRADFVVTPSEHSASRIRIHFPEIEPNVIPWAVDGYLPNLHVPRRDSHQSTRLLCVSSSDPHKRALLAAQAVSLVRDCARTRKALTLTFVYRRGYRHEAFVDAIAKLDPDGRWVTLIEAPSDTELAALYKSSSCLLVPSIDEGFCLPAIEAARAGIPVLHCGRGSLNEVLRDDVKPASKPEDDLYLLANSISDHLRRPKAPAEQTSVANQYSLDTYRARWAQLLERVQLS